MVDFSIEFEETPSILKFLEDMKLRAKTNAFMDVKIFIDDDFAYIHIKPLIFPFYYISIFIWVFGYIFAQGFNMGFFIAGLIPFCTILFYMKHWYFLMMKIGLRKANSRGRIRLL